MSHISSDNDAALITILNNMYNNNIEQLGGLNTSINNLTTVNSRIRELLVQLLRNSTRRTNRNNNRNNNNNNNNNSNNNSNNRQYQGNDNIYRNFDYNLYGQHDFNYIVPTSRDRRQSFDNNNNQQNQFAISNNSRQNARFFDPVPVFPTQTQIELATRRARFSDIVSPRNIGCPISMADFNDTDIVTVIRQCGHIFATDQLNIWFATHCTCPVCRFDIRTTPVNTPSAIIVDPSGNRPDVERVSRSQSAIDPAAAVAGSHTTTNFDNLFSNFPITEAVTRILTDMSGNYTYSNSDPLAVFEFLYQMNNTSPRNR